MGPSRVCHSLLRLYMFIEEVDRRYRENSMREEVNADSASTAILWTDRCDGNLPLSRHWSTVFPIFTPVILAYFRSPLLSPGDPRFSTTRQTVFKPIVGSWRRQTLYYARLITDAIGTGWLMMPLSLSSHLLRKDAGFWMPWKPQRRPIKRFQA